LLDFFFANYLIINDLYKNKLIIMKLVIIFILVIEIYEILFENNCGFNKSILYILIIT